MNLAEMVHGWRKYMRLTTTDAARMLGIDRSALMRLERGEPISQANFAAVLCWLLS